MKINFVAVVSGCELKTSKNGNAYVALNLLDDTGKSMGCMSRDLNLPTKLQPLKKYNIVGDLTLGQFSKLEICSIEPAEE